VLRAVIFEDAADVFARESRSRKPTKMARRIRPSTALKAIWPFEARAQLEIFGQFQRDEFVEHDEEDDGEDDLRVIIHDTADSAWLFVPSSSAALAENFSAFMPSDIAWPSVPRPRSTGYFSLKATACLSDMRATGMSSVTISPEGLRTATQ
jgi:hypothetical protein